MLSLVLIRLVLVVSFNYAHNFSMSIHSYVQQMFIYHLLYVSYYQGSWATSMNKVGKDPGAFCVYILVGRGGYGQ